MQKVINETREFSDSKKGGWPFVASYYAAEFSESVFFDVGLNENNMLKVINIIFKKFVRKRRIFTAVKIFG